MKPGDLDDQDLAYFDAMLDWLRANHCIDERRVFAFGYSNGAQLASVLACERAGAIAGVAIASGSLACTPHEPKAIILSHGTHDTVIPYERAVEAAKAWSARNGCMTPPRAGAVACTVGAACSAAPVVLCTYEGGHEYHEPFSRAAVDFLKAAHR
jgi:polyhydroxybutyrate depolymerase